MNGSNIELIAGVNLAMLIQLASVRETSRLEQAVIRARDAGCKLLRARFWMVSPIEQVFAKP